MFFQSGGCCDGSLPMCFARRRVRHRRPRRPAWATSAGCPFYIDHRQYEAWKHTQLILDVGAGEPEGFSLPAGEDRHFITRSRVFTAAEQVALEGGRIALAICGALSAPLWVPKPHPRHATSRYSWITPPSRFVRLSREGSTFWSPGEASHRGDPGLRGVEFLRAQATTMLACDFFASDGIRIIRTPIRAPRANVGCTKNRVGPLATNRPCGCRKCHPRSSRCQFVFVDETTELVGSS